MSWIAGNPSCWSGDSPDLTTNVSSRYRTCPPTRLERPRRPRTRKQSGVAHPLRFCSMQGWGCRLLACLPLTGKWRDELARGQIVQGAEATGELVGAQAAVAVERAHKFDGVAVGLQ
jgi:hypothetical protein